MKNNKGFAISAVVYSMIILFLMLMLLILIMLSSRKVILDKQKTNSLNEINGTEEQLNLYKEAILNGAYPELYSGLVPIIIEKDGTVKKADTTKMWYNYQNKIWANAVILFGEDDYSPGDIIIEEEIKQYYVWIPRYRYELWNTENEGLYPDGTQERPTSINIVFENKKSVVSNGIENGEWVTHPAFTSFNTNGIWVGKFETSYNESTFTDNTLFATNESNHQNATNSTNIIIKPNVRSLTGRRVSQFYQLSIGTNSDLNSHMMKNSEWGAVTYLAYSEYGKCDNGVCEEIYINNVGTQGGATITGCSSDSLNAQSNDLSSSCQVGYTWDGTNNKASTTGNISGIYDMSGGNIEYVMSVLKDQNGNPISGGKFVSNSGFNGSYSSEEGTKVDGINFPEDERYYDLYEPYTTTLDDDTWDIYDNGKLGDATKEIALNNSSLYGENVLWYSNYAKFATMSYPWFTRGGSWDKSAYSGIFAFNHYHGDYSLYRTFRIVLAPI